MFKNILIYNCTSNFIQLSFKNFVLSISTDITLLNYRMEMAEVEERKSTQIADLIKHHDTAYNEMKNYYNDITLNNLALINSLKVRYFY